MADWKAAPLAPFVATSQEAPGFWMQGCLWTVLAFGEQTGGQYSLIEQLMPGQAGPPPHVHDRQVEVFYILDGQMRLQVGTELMTASAGTLISIPPGPPIASASSATPQGSLTSMFLPPWTPRSARSAPPRPRAPCRGREPSSHPAKSRQPRS